MRDYDLFKNTKLSTIQPSFLEQNNFKIHIRGPSQHMLAGNPGLTLPHNGVVIIPIYGNVKADAFTLLTEELKTLTPAWNGTLSSGWPYMLAYSDPLRWKMKSFTPLGLIEDNHPDLPYIILKYEIPSIEEVKI